MNDDDSESENSDEADELEAKERRRSTGRDSDESSEDDEDDDEDGDLDLEVDEELRAKILEALKESGVNEGDDHDELNGEDDSFEEEEELLDDDQMMELDDKLAEIFKQRNSASKTAKQAAQASHDAQLKVIDLLEIYAKQQSANPLLLHIFLPLFNAARRSGKEDSDIASKAARALNGIVSKAKDYPVVKDPGYVLETLKSIHEGSARSGTEDVEGLAVSTSLYLCKVALASEESEIETAIVDIYLSSLNAYLIKKSCRLHGRFFESFINRYRETAWQLRESLIEACSENTKTSDKHRRATCFHLMSSLFNTHASLVSPPFRRLPKRFTNRVFQKSPEAKREVIDFMPRYVEVFFSTFEAASEGAGMGLQIARLREIIKACSEAVRATKTALKNGPSGNTWDIWRSTELSDVFARMTRSTKIEKAGSLNSAIRGLMDSINQGSGRAKVRSVKNGEPDMLPMDASGKAVTPLDQRQIKKAQSKKENKKRKRQEKEDVDVSAQAVAEEHVASTSEDSD